eukprot:3066757-Pyramimonas_sp.AAC.1
MSPLLVSSGIRTTQNGVHVRNNIPRENATSLHPPYCRTQGPHVRRSMEHLRAYCSSNPRLRSDSREESASGGTPRG